jgi:GAF domain-containing protein
MCKPNHLVVRLQEIVITPRLADRPVRTNRAQQEMAALTDIARGLAQGRHALLETLCMLGMRLCRAGSCGITLLEPATPEGGLYWAAVAGKAAGSIAATAGTPIPRHASPSGYCLSQNAPQLFSYPDRVLRWMTMTPRVTEVLVVPLFGKDKQATGTVWAFCHEEEHQFDREDLRILTGLASHASAALRVQRALTD